MNAVMFYCVNIFKQSDSSINTTMANSIVGSVMILSVFAALVMDKAGRRTLLILSSSMMTISISGLGVFFFIEDNLGDRDLGDKLDFIPVLSLSIFVFAFSLGFGPIPWLMMSELFPPGVKSSASSVTTSFNWAVAFLVTKFFSTMVTNITQAGAFWMFGTFNILSFLFCFFFVPETKGKSLDEIQQLFISDKPYFLNMGPWKNFRGDDSEDRKIIVQEEVPA